MTQDPSPKTPEPRSLVILCGGRSAEHDVSLMSTAAALGNIEPGRFDISVIGIERDGGTMPAERLRERLGDVATGVHCPATDDWIAHLAELEQGRVIFPLLHGPYGEDGTVQGLLDVLDLAYVGAGVGGSAVGMNKVYTKRILESGGVAVLPYRAFTSVEWASSSAGIAAECADLGLPVFVKPASLGSSVGVSRCRDVEAVHNGVDAALRFDDQVLVERGVDAREIEVSVIGNLEPEVSVPGEIVPGDEFYTYEAKYLDDSSGLLIPAPLEPDQTERIRRTALAGYRLLSLEGMARVDFLLDRETGELWLNEVNTIPGFTPISMYPKMWEATGLAYTDLIGRLMDLALERWERRRRISTER